MTNEEKKESWLKIIAIIIATFIGAFLAFYLAVDLTINRMMDPSFHMKKFEKIMQKNLREFEHMEKELSENPFLPKMPPMLVNLAKENNEYKIIVDLKQIGNDEKNIKVSLKNNIITISGEFEKIEHKRENIMNFSQSYYLDEKLNPEKMTQEKLGKKYIITIPFDD